MLLSCFIELSGNSGKLYKGDSYLLLELILHTKNHISRDRQKFSFETRSKRKKRSNLHSL